MHTIKTKSNVLDYIKNVLIVIEEYTNGSLYIGLYDTKEHELYTDISTYIMPVLQNELFVKTGTEQERFCIEQKNLFYDMETEVKQGFNTYHLYKFTGNIN